jgi:predicted nucleic acid-binding protein
MASLVADTSTLVSLGTVADMEPSPLRLLPEEYDALIPYEVENELRVTASYEDAAAHAAQFVLEESEQMTIVDVSPDPSFPLDDGENAAVAVANQHDTDLLLCDEFNEIGIVHASLTDTRLMTTPSLLRAFAKWEVCTAQEAETLLDEIAGARSWAHNRYAERARECLQRMIIVRSS